MKVALRATALLSPLTGIGQYARCLALELQREPDVDLHLFYGGPWSQQVRQAPVAGMASARSAIRRFVPRPHYLFRAIEQIGFTTGARLRGIQLYHEPAFLPLRHRGPTVVTAHDLSWVWYPQTHPAERVAVMTDIFPRIVHEVAHLITDAEFVRQEIIRKFGVAPERITAIPLAARALFGPCEPAVMQPTLSRLGLAERGYLLCVGTLEPRKNLGLVIKAFAQLRPAQQARYPLVIAGMSGWHTSPLERLLRPLVDAGTVRTLGFVDDQALAHLYAGARMLVYPSLYEGFGLPPLEAMASGTPVIASSASTLPEVVGDAGLLVDPADDAALARAIEQLDEDDALWTRLRDAGLARASGFSWQRCAQQTLAVYRKVLAQC